MGQVIFKKSKIDIDRSRKAFMPKQGRSKCDQDVRLRQVSPQNQGIFTKELVEYICVCYIILLTSIKSGVEQSFHIYV